MCSMTLFRGNKHTKVVLLHYYMDGERRPQLAGQMSNHAHFGRSIRVQCEPTRKVRRSEENHDENLDNDLVEKGYKLLEVHL